MQIHEKKDTRLIYTCSFCEKAYLYKCSLTKHLKTHSSESSEKEDDESISTAPSSLDGSLEPKLSKKTKTEENAPTPQLSLQDLITSALQKTTTQGITETLSFNFFQSLIGGGFQNLKITIEPIESVDNEPYAKLGNEEELVREFNLMPEVNNENLQHINDGFLDNFFNTAEQVPGLDFGFILENL